MLNTLLAPETMSEIPPYMVSILVSRKKERDMRYGDKCCEEEVHEAGEGNRVPCW